MSGTILVVDDDRSMCELLAEGLGKKGFDVHWRTAVEAARELLTMEELDVVVTDLNLRGTNGIELCAEVVARRPDVPVIVITGYGSLETAVEAMRAGAYDFVAKPLKVDALALTIERAVRHRALREEVERLKQAVSDRFDDLLGNSAPMRKVYDLLERVAGTNASVLITGESGTGKELAARALHHRGARSGGPFVAVNCSALPEPLLESELFGHARGAFTDARAARQGLIVQAHGGTLLLDEIGDMPLSLQPKLLRVLQERRLRPVGGDVESEVDVRFVAATNRDLEVAVEERRFREDLFFRINVVQVALPPLRARGNDILLLAQRFIERFSEASGKPVKVLSPRAAERLMAYPWPGNVRELQSCIERAIALCGGGEIGVADLPEKIGRYRPSEIPVASDNPDELVPLEEIERRYILRVLEALGGNKRLAAKTLGLDRRTLYRKLAAYGVSAEADHDKPE